MFIVMLKAEAVLRSAVSSQEVAREWQYCHAIICCWIVCMVLDENKKRLRYPCIDYTVVITNYYLDDSVDVVVISSIAGPNSSNTSGAVMARFFL